MNIRRYLIILLPLLSLCACKPKVESERPVIQYVSEIIQERANPAHQLLGAFDPKNAEGNIVVFGPLQEARPLSRSLLLFDKFDNVDARPVRDSLLDFSGEVVSRVIMADLSPLDAFGTEAGAARLRELTVKAALACMDTLTRGKVVILTSSAMAAYGKYDVDSLMRAFHIADAVFFPLELMAEKIPDNPETRVGIVSSRSAQLYEEFFKYRDDFEGHFVGVYPGQAVLDSISVVDTLALDLLLLDDYSVSADTLRARFPGVEIITPGEVTSEACFKAMRRRSIFTHRVSYPRRETFTALLNEDSEYILKDSDDRELL